MYGDKRSNASDMKKSTNRTLLRGVISIVCTDFYGDTSVKEQKALKIFHLYEAKLLALLTSVVIYFYEETFAFDEKHIGHVFKRLPTRQMSAVSKKKKEKKARCCGKSGSLRWQLTRGFDLLLAI
ncbi:hypothetical protein PoB_003363000 [Plakobranchus ocellatus]|uniref:HORMA domain-containing protein n=1 Tax=Plakobranchus ocellatus TaxID=259542 RepID=A0AAV4AJW1_9GAST|nr:hypothetical protein PoB_003363000 [Plakobranchus ocellatus]